MAHGKSLPPRQRGESAALREARSPRTGGSTDLVADIEETLGGELREVADGLQIPARPQRRCVLINTH